MRLARVMVALFLVLAGEPAAAETTTGGRFLTVRSRRGDTPAKVAKRYYGDPDKKLLVAAANNLGEKARLRRGKSLRIPTAWSYRIRQGDTWSRLAQDYLGHKGRGGVLARINGKKIAQQPPVRHVIIIPAVVPVRSARLRDVTDVAAKLLKQPRRARVVRDLAKIIRSYNRLRTKWVKTGQAVLVPFRDLKVQQWYLPSTLPSGDPGGRRQAAEILAQVTKDLRAGRYVSVVRRVSGFVDLPRLDDTDLAVRLLTSLCTAYVALGRREMALRAARAALGRKPGLKLDPVQVSPKVRAVFTRAGQAKGGGK